MKTIAYRSNAVRHLTDHELLSLAYGAQRFNASVGVTGLLIVDRGAFAQVIEGSEKAISQVWERIQQDPLHKEISAFIDEPIHRRLHPDWAMLNSGGHQAASVKTILQFALDNPPTLTTTGQIKAARAILARLD